MFTLSYITNKVHSGRIFRPAGRSILIMGNYIQILLICFTLVVLSYQNEEDSQTKGQDTEPKELSQMEKEKKHQMLLAAIENRAKYSRIREKSGCVSIDCMKKYVQNIKERKFKRVKVGRDSSPIAGGSMHKPQDYEDLDVDFDSINKTETREKRFDHDSGRRHKRLLQAQNTDSNCATVSCKTPEGYCVELEPLEYIGVPIPNHPLLECCPLYKCYFHGHLGQVPSPSQVLLQSNSQNQSPSPRTKGTLRSIQSKKRPNQEDIKDSSASLNMVEPNLKVQSENKKVDKEDNKANVLHTGGIMKGETKRENTPNKNGVSITSHVSGNGTKIVEGVGTGNSDVTVNASDDDDFDEKEMEDMLREMEEVKNAGLEEIALSKMSAFKPVGLGGAVTNVVGGLLGSNSIQDPIQHKSSQNGNGLLGGLTNAIGIPGHQTHNTPEPNKGVNNKAKASSSSIPSPPDSFLPKKGGGLFGILG